MNNLSQAEIDALLRGETVSDDGPKHEETGELDISQFAAETGPSSTPETPEGRDVSGTDFGELDDMLVSLDKSGQYLTPGERDVLGEIGNICMGTAATTMYTILGHRVTITTPEVRVYSSEEVLAVYKSPFVAVQVEYTEGVEGKNLLILKEYDAALITDLLMGGEGKVEEEHIELNEIHLSAISEIMNQMIGSSATSLSSLLGMPVNITPPETVWVEKNSDVSDLLDGSHLVIKISFDMIIEGVLKSKLMQLMSVESGKKMAKLLMDTHNKVQPAPVPEMRQQTAAVSPQPPVPVPQPVPVGTPQPTVQGQPFAQPSREEASRRVDVKPLHYDSFDEPGGGREASRVQTDALERIGDIPLQVAVELGRTKKSINEVMEMGVGSVIVLDKLAGELVEVIVNGKQIARGEVVVIDENYGVRITDIVAGRDRYL